MNKLAIAFWGFILSIMACAMLIYFSHDSSAPAAAQIADLPTEADAPTSTYVPPTTTPWRFPAGTQVGDLALGGMTEAVAEQSLREHYQAVLRPLTLVAPTSSWALSPAEIDLHLDITTTLELARSASSTANPALLAPAVQYDAAALQQQLDVVAAAIEITPTVAFSPTATAFVATPGLRLDRAASLVAIEAALADPGASRRVELVTSVVTATQRPTPDALAAALAELEDDWGGMLGVSVLDLNSATAFDYHGDTVFSGMSVLKIAILLQSFISRAEFTENQQDAIALMIQDSDNDASNELLAMIGAGDGLEGVQTMNATLREALGIEITRLTAPFESIDYLNRFEGIEFPDPGPEGPRPYTDADPYVRATPNEMVTLVHAIVSCSNGSGPLLKLDDSALTPARCTEMLDILATNKDTNKIVAGVPATAFVAHKSGWIDDCRADAGYVRTAAGNEYVVALWIWDDEYIETEVSDPLLAAMSQLVYTSFEPLVLEP